MESNSDMEIEEGEIQGEENDLDSTLVSTPLKCEEWGDLTKEKAIEYSEHEYGYKGNEHDEREDQRMSYQQHQYSNVIHSNCQNQQQEKRDEEEFDHLIKNYFLKSKVAPSTTTITDNMCKKCHINFKSFNLLKIHNKEVKHFQCDICNATFKLNNDLKAHMRDSSHKTKRAGKQQSDLQRRMEHPSNPLGFTHVPMESYPNQQHPDSYQIPELEADHYYFHPNYSTTTPPPRHLPPLPQQHLHYGYLTHPHLPSPQPIPYSSFTRTHFPSQQQLQSNYFPLPPPNMLPVDTIYATVAHNEKQVKTVENQEPKVRNKKRKKRTNKQSKLLNDTNSQKKIQTEEKFDKTRKEQDLHELRAILRKQVQKQSQHSTDVDFVTGSKDQEELSLHKQQSKMKTTTTSNTSSLVDAFTSTITALSSSFFSSPSKLPHANPNPTPPPILLKHPSQTNHHHHRQWFASKQHEAAAFPPKTLVIQVNSDSETESNTENDETDEECKYEEKRSSQLSTHTQYLDLRKQIKDRENALTFLNREVKPSLNSAGSKIENRENTLNQEVKPSLKPDPPSKMTTCRRKVYRQHRIPNVHPVSSETRLELQKANENAVLTEGDQQKKCQSELLNERINLELQLQESRLQLEKNNRGLGTEQVRSMNLEMHEVKQAKSKLQKPNETKALQAEQQTSFQAEHARSKIQESERKLEEARMFLLKQQEARMFQLKQQEGKKKIRDALQAHESAILEQDQQEKRHMGNSTQESPSEKEKVEEIMHKSEPEGLLSPKKAEVKLTQSKKPSIPSNLQPPMKAAASDIETNIRLARVEEQWAKIQEKSAQLSQKAEQKKLGQREEQLFPLWDTDGVPLLWFRSSRLHPQFGDMLKAASNPNTAVATVKRNSSSFSHAIDPTRQICEFDLFGTCNDQKCEDVHKCEFHLSKEMLLCDMLSYFSYAVQQRLGTTEQNQQQVTCHKRRRIDSGYHENSSSSSSSISPSSLISEINRLINRSDSSSFDLSRLPSTVISEVYLRDPLYSTPGMRDRIRKRSRNEEDNKNINVSKTTVKHDDIATSALFLPLSSSSLKKPSSSSREQQPRYTSSSVDSRYFPQNNLPKKEISEEDKIIASISSHLEEWLD